MSGYIYAIRIEAVGNSDGLYRWAWGRSMLDDPGAADPDSLYQTGLLRWPTQVTFGIDFRESSSKLGSASFALRRTDTVGSTFYRLRRAVTALFLGPLPVNETDTSITLDQAGLTGVLIWGREAVTILAEGPPATYLVDRGSLGTTAISHGVELSDDRELFQAHSAATLTKRKVELIRVPMDSAGYAEEQVVWIGVLRSIRSPDPGQISLEADNALSLVKDQELMKSQWRGYILPGGVQERRISIWGEKEEYPRGQQPDAGIPGHPDGLRFVVGLKGAAYIAWGLTSDMPSGLAEIVLAGGSPSIPFAGSPEYREDSMPKERDEVWEILSSHEDQPSNALVIADNTLPLSKNPAILTLQLLTSTDNDGEPGPNGPYDTGIANLAGGIPIDLIDVDAVLAWADRVIGRRDRDVGQIECLHLGLEGKPEKLHDVIQRVLAPYGATLTQANGGLISIAQLTDGVEIGVEPVRISQSQVLDVPQQDRRIWSAADKIKATYNDRPGVGPDRLNVVDGVRLNRVPPGQSSRIELDMGWIPLRRTAIGLATAWTARWHEPIASVSIKTTNEIDLWPGDPCFLSHEKVYNAGGSLGIVDGLYLVESRKEQLNQQGHILSYDLLYVGAMYDTAPVGIPPNLTIIGYNPAGPTLTVEMTNWVGPDGSPIGVLDIQGFSGESSPGAADGDMIQITDEFGAVLDPLDNPTQILTVGAVNTIDLTAPLNTAPGVGDIVRFAAYGNCVATQQAKWAFVADANNRLDGTDPAKEYRFA